jgi:hypothetical protein
LIYCQLVSYNLTSFLCHTCYHLHPAAWHALFVHVKVIPDTASLIFQSFPVLTISIHLKWTLYKTYTGWFIISDTVSNVNRMLCHNKTIMNVISLETVLIEFYLNQKNGRTLTSWCHWWRHNKCLFFQAKGCWSCSALFWKPFTNHNHIIMYWKI